MVEVELIGLKTLVANLGRLPESMREKLRVFIARFTIVLGANVKANIVSRFRSTGPLYSSVRSNVSEAPSGVTGTVTIGGGTVRHAAIQEYGGTTPPHDIVPVNAKALAFHVGGGGFSSGGGQSQLVFARIVHHPGSRIPERSYARFALVQLRGAFESGIRQVTQEVVHEAFAVAAE